MQNSAADQLRGLGQVTPLHWVSGDKRKSYYVHYTAPPTAVANNGLRAAKPRKESPRGSQSPSLHAEAEHKLFLKPRIRKHFLPALPLQARELFKNRFAQVELTDDTLRTLQVYD